VRPQLQQQLQEELAAAGITSTTVSGSSRSSSTPSGSDGGKDAPGHLRDQDSKAAAASTAGSKHQADGNTGQPGSTAAAAAAFDAASLAQRRERLLALFVQGGPDLLKQLPLLSACLNEAMRLYPAGAPGAPR
jgi:hypothetical protein